MRERQGHLFSENSYAYGKTFKLGKYMYLATLFGSKQMELFTDSLEVILTKVRMSESKLNSKGTKTLWETDEVWMLCR